MALENAVRRVRLWAVATGMVGLVTLSDLPSASALLGLAGWPLDETEILVGFRPGIAPDAALDVLADVGGTPIDEIEQIHTYVISVPVWSEDAIIGALEILPEVEFVEPNEAVAPVGSANDPYFSSQWHLPKIRATEAWDVTTGSPDVMIAVLDSGVDPTHPDLAPKLVSGWNFFDGNADTSDVYGHGTKVAGAAAAIGNNGIGVASVALESYLMPVRVTDTAGYGYYSTISQGITWAADHGARVMNVSFANITSSSAITSAARYARSKGALVVAAAGNCGCDDATPENPDLISVGATTGVDDLASYSSRGAYVDVSAPGSSIHTTSRGGGYVSVAGTSYASPVTAGVVALLMAANPSLSPNEIEEALESAAVDLGAAGHDTSFGFGRIDAAAAVASVATAPQPPPDTTAPSVSISSPSDGQTVSGTTTVNVLAFDDVNVAAVDLYRDGAALTTDSSPPYSFAWNTMTTSNGGHTLQAVARDDAGNVGASAASSVMVSNVSATPTPSASPTPTPTVKRKGGGKRR